MNKTKGGNTRARARILRATVLAGMCAAAAGALAQVPPLDPGAPSISDKARPGAGVQRGTAPSDPAVVSRQPPPRAPIDRTRAIVIPRENCGTFWTGWEKDPSANANPCPANCERGERLDVRERKTDSGMQYQAHYRCNLPELVVYQPPGASREPGAPRRTNCGTFWTIRQSDPNAGANPCPANCERGELLDVRRGRSGDKLYYEMNYRCYVAQPRAPAPTQTATQTPATTPPSTSGSAPAPGPTSQTTTQGGSTPPPTSAPKATARLNLAPMYQAALGGGTFWVGGNRIGIGLYPTIDAGSTYGLHISPDSGGRLRVRATISNIQGATTLLMESAEATTSCPLARNPGYNNFQTCDLVFDLPAAREVRVVARKPRDTVVQVTVVKFDVTRESPSGGVLAAAQVVLSGPQTTFDQLPGAKVTAAAGPVGTAAHVTLNDNSTVAVNLIGAPAGTYRFRAMVSNTSAATQFSVQSPGKQSTCSIPATAGYQNATPCEIVVTVPTSGTNQTVSFTKQAGGATEATVDTVYVFQE